MAGSSVHLVFPAIAGLPIAQRMNSSIRSISNSPSEWVTVVAKEGDSVGVLPTALGGAGNPVGVGASTLTPIVETGVGFVVSLWLSAI